VPWRDREYCVLDVETTGLDLQSDEVVSFGAVLVRHGRVVVSTAAYGLVRPSRAVSVASVSVHALRAEDLADAPPLADCVRTLRGLLEGRVLVAHAAWVEQAFLGRAFRAHHESWRVPTVDTAGLARALGVAASAPGREPPLEQLAGHLGLPVHTPHHALGDALTTASVFLALAARLEQQGRVRRVGDLVRLSRRPGPRRVTSPSLPA